jgi:RNA polymerase sigma-70 factor, ECF subfamily
MRILTRNLGTHCPAKKISEQFRKHSVLQVEGQRVSEAVIVSEAAVSEAKPLAKGDALEAAVREHARLVYRISFSVLRNHHDAEDATQEVFMRVLRYRRDLADLEDVRTWLARIAWRVAVERRRKVKASLWESFEESEMPVRSHGTAAAILLSNEQMKTVETLIATLPAKLRDPLTLSTVEEMTPAAVAAILKINEAAVRSRIFRARQILREKLAALMGGSYGT